MWKCWFLKASFLQPYAQESVQWGGNHMAPAYSSCRQWKEGVVLTACATPAQMGYCNLRSLVGAWSTRGRREVRSKRALSVQEGLRVADSFCQVESQLRWCSCIQQSRRRAIVCIRDGRCKLMVYKSYHVHIRAYGMMRHSAYWKTIHTPRPVFDSRALPSQLSRLES